MAMAIPLLHSGFIGCDGCTITIEGQGWRLAADVPRLKGIQEDRRCYGVTIERVIYSAQENLNV